MRTKEERRVRHTTSPKVQRSNTLNHDTNAEEIVQENGRIYKRINLNNQKMYIPLSTDKE